jgi:hypothetical protein
MKHASLPALIMAVLVCCTILAPVSSVAGVPMRERLHSTVVAHVDANSVDGKYMYFDIKVGKVVGLLLANVRARILPLGQFFVVSTDFTDEMGNNVEIDFLTALTTKGFRVFQTQVSETKAFSGIARADRKMFASLLDDQKLAGLASWRPLDPLERRTVSQKPDIATPNSSERPEVQLINNVQSVPGVSL